MPRPRKYDYTKDYPITIFAKVPVGIINKLNNLGYTNADISREIDESLVLINFLEEFLNKKEK
ncbi:hypothetical protein [Psychrobacillus sp. FSL H8-0487]|uniref:hypothetical protein n=1 Tax=Psychrobacillus sp. FSL H8-0487 TaxID=2921391 RepID=UPI0030F673D0